MKLQCNPLAHQNTPADYFISWIEKSIFLKNALIECKQVTCKEGKGRLAFKRLKQMNDLFNFKTLRMNYHEAYFCIAFYDGGWLGSEVYLIPIHKIYEDVLETKKKSFNRDVFKEKYGDYLLQIQNGILLFPQSWRE